MLTEFARKRNKRNVAGQYGVVTIPFSFETNEQSAFKHYFPINVRITKIRAVAQKAIAATDTGTLTGANATGASTGGVVTFAISDVIGTEKTATPTTNNTVVAGSYYQITSAKTTAGGKGFVSIEYVTI